MSAENNTFPFEAIPRIIPAGEETGILLSPIGHGNRFVDGAEYEVSVYPLEDHSGRSDEETRIGRIPVQDGTLRLRHRFAGEQEHLIRVDLVSGGEKKTAGSCRVYSVGRDLLARTPWKGDFHMHSDMSDGKEPPPYVAACCRRIGLDFMALTDHWKYEPSKIARQAFSGLPIDLRIHTGEEVHHEPYCPVHIVHFGGSFSVNDRISQKDEYLSAVSEIERSIPAQGLTDAQRFNYAQCLWTYRNIREAGGISVFCHPYWFESSWYNVPEALIARHFAEKPFDAYELIGGYHRHEVESNTLQVSRYHEERSRGNNLPIIGASDAHGCERGELFGWYYTIVFSQSTDLPELRQAIRDLWSVTVEALPGESPRAHGPFRLAKFALFLIREIFPEHDRMCAEEGRLMLAHIAGDKGASDALGRLKGQTEKLRRRLWAFQ